MRKVRIRLLKELSSLKMAVLVILALAAISAVGTIYESKYDAEYAQKIVYQSWVMYGALFFLCVNLIAVMVSRWPWKRQHTPFILAHIGILILLVGAWLTQKFGVDGSMSFRIGESRREVTVSQQEVSVYGSFDGKSYQRLVYEPVDFLRSGPIRQPLVYHVGSDPLEVLQYIHFAARDSQILASEKQGDGPAVRVNLQNAFANQTEWVRRDSRKPAEIKNFGPARLVLSDGTYRHSEDVNELVLEPGARSQVLKYSVFKKGKGLTKSGVAQEGSTIQTDWMGLVVRLLRYFPHSWEKVEFHDNGTPNKQTTPAIQIRFLGETQWLGLNSQMRMFTKEAVYQINFNNSQVQLPFDLKLDAFQVGRYPGTQRAASYESEVTVNQADRVLISMNEPLKHGGFTFYQSSFEEDETGKPIISVLSVNRDPGRFLKYLGSALIVFGSILLFYFKRQFWRPRRET